MNAEKIVRVGGLQEVGGTYLEYELYNTGLLFAYKTAHKVPLTSC